MRKKRPATSAWLEPTSRGERPAPAPATHQVPREVRSISSPGWSPKNPSKKPTCPSRGREGAARRVWVASPGAQGQRVKRWGLSVCHGGFPPEPAARTAGSQSVTHTRQATPESELWSGQDTASLFHPAVPQPQWVAPPARVLSGPWRARPCHTLCLGHGAAASPSLPHCVSVCLSVFTKATFT